MVLKDNVNSVMDKENFYVPLQMPNDPKQRAYLLAINRQTGKLDTARFDKGHLDLGKDFNAQAYLLEGHFLYVTGVKADKKSFVAAIDLESPFEEFASTISKAELRVQKKPGEMPVLPLTRRSFLINQILLPFTKQLPKGKKSGIVKTRPPTH